MLAAVRGFTAPTRVAYAAAVISRARIGWTRSNGRAERFRGSVGHWRGDVCMVCRMSVRPAFTAGCLTRVIFDDGNSVEVAQLQSVVQRIQCVLQGVPAAQREYIAKALLNLAISRTSRKVDG